MFVSTKRHERMLKEQLDVTRMVLEENRRLQALLRLSLRNKKPLNRNVDVAPEIPSFVADDPPAEVMAAIDSTFPGDRLIREANLKYAFSQKHRWEKEAREIADEIIQGRN